MPTGIYKRTEYHKKKISNALKGRIFSKEWKNKISLSHIGVKNVNYGKHFSKEIKLKISNANKGKKYSKEHNQKISIARKGMKFTNKHKENMKLATLKNPTRYWLGKKRLPISKEWRNNLKLRFLNKQYKKTHIELLKKSQEKSWSDENRENHIKAILQGLIKRPTSLEKQMINIIKQNNLPYKYVGDGSFLIGYKNPDFININGEKKLIEVGNIFHHQNDYKNKRRAHFAKYGWKSYIFIMDKLNEKQILSDLLKGGEI